MYGRTDRRTDGWTASRLDRWTDGWTDGQMEKLRNVTTDIAGFKVACTQLKMGFDPEKISKVHKLTCIWVKQRKNYL